jgi:hypothetical protein
MGRAILKTQLVVFAGTLWGDALMLLRFDSG